MFDKTEEREGEICEWEKLENDCIAAAAAAIHTIQQTQGESLSQRFTLQSLQSLKVTETREFACNWQEFPIIQMTECGGSGRLIYDPA